MNDPQNPRDDADRPDEDHDPVGDLGSLMRRVAYTDVHHRFGEAVTASQKAIEDPEQRAALAFGLDRVRAVAGELSIEKGVLGAILIVVRANPADPESFGFSRSFAATPAVIDTALPLTHLAHQFEMEGVEVPGLADAETTIEPGEPH